MQVLTFGIKQT